MKLLAGKHRHIDEHTLNVLEYEQVLELLAGYASSVLGEETARKLYPSTDEGWIRQRLTETSEMKGLLELGMRIPMAGMKDIRRLLDNLGRKQSVYEPGELIDIADTLQASTLLKTYFSGLKDETAGHLKKFAVKLQDYSAIVEEINRCIGADKTIADEASGKLKETRRQIGLLADQVQQKLRKIMNAPDMRNAIANDNFMTRNGRAVILIKANYHQRLRGMVLDRSKTGAALYVEPYEIVELNNELESTLYDERKEEMRILQELTRQVSVERDSILRTIGTLGLIDLCYAKAKFSMAYHMNAPVVTGDKTMLLRNARHPLLMEIFSQQRQVSIDEVIDDVVPLDIRLGDDFDLLLITGPNTGGKTVTLKTTGLLALMVQSGMHIPAWADSRMPVYRQIFSDIGDEQSIQQSLSTFSAHMTQIINIVKRANDHSLVLLDELGSGTDPSEGACLGHAILDTLREQNVSLVATTHLGQLKNYAYSTKRVENASVMFDVETLKPTYQLVIGTPGSSNAVSIAKRLGMPKVITKLARDLLEKEKDGSSHLINKLHSSRKAIEKDRQSSQEMLDSAKAMHILAAERLERAAEEQALVTKQADKYIDDSVRKVRSLLEAYLSEMQNAPKGWKEKAMAFGEDVLLAAASTPLAQRQAAFIEQVRKGDMVYVKPFRRTGLVQRINKKRQQMSLLVNGKEVTLPFEDIIEPFED